MIETGVLFGKIHSYDDLNLILSSADIAPAAPKTSYVDIPGADGSLDMTEALGEVKYSDRKITLTFAMNPAGDLSETAWEEKKTEVSNLLNGKQFRITLDKDDGYYWLGRCAVNSYKSDKRLRKIVIVATVNPYKFKQTETAITINLTEAPQMIKIRNARKSVCPMIECTNANARVTFDGKTIVMNAGVHKYLDIVLAMGINQIEVSGTGSMTFRFQEGEL